MPKVPNELKHVDSWICHKGKVPKNPKTGRNLTGNPDNWGTSLEDAEKAVAKYGFDGLGFVFKSSNPYCGIDIDKCVNNGNLNAFASALISQCDSYAEFSPSGTGIHIIVKHETSEKVLLKTKEIEVYNRGRYFTFTGDSINEKPVNEYDVMSIVNSKNGGIEVDGLPMADSVSPIDHIINKIETAGNDKITDLWSGKWKEMYGSRSEADFALCNMLLPYVSTEKEMDELFRRSGLMRPKWDRSIGGNKTYGAETIRKVMSDVVSTTVSRSSSVVEMDDFMTMKMPEIKMLMSPWLTQGSTHMIYAKRGVGKTYFCMSLGLAVAHHTDFGDWEIKESSNVMYVDGEMLPQQMVERINGLRNNLGDKDKKWFILSSGLNLQRGESAINISKPVWQAFIQKEVIEKKIGLLVLDNIAALTPGMEENDSTSWDNISSWLNSVKQTGCAVILVHHAGKGGQQRGTSAREDALDTVIHLKSVASDASEGVNVDIVFEKSRHIAGNSVRTCNFKLVSEPGKKELIWNIGSANNTRKIAVCGQLCNGKTQTEIMSKLGISSKTVVKYKKQAMDDGWITEENGKVVLTNLGRVMMAVPDDETTDF